LLAAAEALPSTLRKAGQAMPPPSVLLLLLRFALVADLSFLVIPSSKAMLLRNATSASAWSCFSPEKFKNILSERWNLLQWLPNMQLHLLVANLMQTFL
jgi:hypothetical protein